MSVSTTSWRVFNGPGRGPHLQWCQNISLPSEKSKPNQTRQIDQSRRCDFHHEIHRPKNNIDNSDDDKKKDNTDIRIATARIAATATTRETLPTN